MYIRPRTHLFKIPEEMPTDVAVFVEEMAVAYHSLARASVPFAPVNEGFGPGMSVAVLGNGPLGILHGIMARIQGAGLSIATDLSNLRLNTAKNLYADVTINAANVGVEERIQRVKELTEGVGPDLVIESAGEPEVFIEALRMVRKGGTVIEVGNWVDLQKDVALDVMRHISSKNLHIHSVPLWDQLAAGIENPPAAGESLQFPITHYASLQFGRARERIWYGDQVRRVRQDRSRPSQGLMHCEPLDSIVDCDLEEQ